MINIAQIFVVDFKYAYLLRNVIKIKKNNRINLMIFANIKSKNLLQKIKVTNNLFLYKNKKELNSLIEQNKIDYILLCEVFDISKYFTAKNIKKIFFFHHGLTPNKKCLIKKNLLPWIKTTHHILTCCNNQYSFLKENNKDVTKISRLPQFDNFDIQKMKKYNNTILVLNGRNNKQYRNMIYSSILLNLMKKYTNKNIFFKCKKNEYPIKVDKITYINSNKYLVYEFMNCDGIVIIEGGTSYIEALMHNCNVILCTYMDGGTYMNISSKEYPYLLISETKEQFLNCFNILLNYPDYFKSKEYIDDKNKYIKFVLGENNVTFEAEFTDFIINYDKKLKNTEK